MKSFQIRLLKVKSENTVELKVSQVNLYCRITEPVREKRAQSNSSEEPDSKVNVR